MIVYMYYNYHYYTLLCISNYKPNPLYCYKQPVFDVPLRRYRLSLYHISNYTITIIVTNNIMMELPISKDFGGNSIFQSQQL